MNGIFHQFQHALRRHHAHAMHPGHRGFSGFGGRHHPRGGDDRWQQGLDGLQRGRKLGAADLQLLLLALLAERPSHGYELIKALDERSGGYYSPSPGMVYPALTYLEETGHASVETLGTKKLYSVTAAGQAHLDEHRAAADALLKQLVWIGMRMTRLREAVAGSDTDGPRSADGASTDDNTDDNTDDDTDRDSPSGLLSGHGRGRHAHGAPEMRAARRNLKSALLDKAGAGRDEQRRIAAILERAAAAIRDAGAADPTAVPRDGGSEDRA